MVKSVCPACGLATLRGPSTASVHFPQTDSLSPNHEAALFMTRYALAIGHLTEPWAVVRVLFCPFYR